MLCCPRCESKKIVKNGFIHNGKQNYKCRECGRQFVENPTKKYISQETWELVDRLRAEKMSVAAISRVTGISQLWLQQYVNKKNEEGGALK